ncbi:MAG TPA: hypothetical protein DF613_03690 [Lachnospiraceae bacterium]|nr:hypothetical protein [Lachnospiraceae bacterium]
MKKKGIRFLLFWALALAALCLAVPVQAAKVINNGTDTLQYGKYIYYLDGNNNIYRIGTDNKGKKKLGTTDVYPRQLYILGNKLYFGRKGKVYATPLNKNSAKAVVSGTLLGAYGNRIFYLDGKGNVYAITTDKKEKKFLFTLTPSGEITSAGTSGKVLILNCEANAASTHVVYVDMSNVTWQVLTKETRASAYENRPRVEDFVVKNNTLYYASGYFGGTGYFFNGNLKKISLTGEGETTIAKNIGSENSFISVNFDCLLYENGGYLYYSDNSGAKKYKFSNGKISSAAGNGFFTSAGKYVYYAETKKKTVTVYRFSLNGSSAKGKKVASFKVKDNCTYSVSKASQAGKYVVLRFDKRTFGGRWQGDYQGTDVYKMKTDGKGLKKIG